MKAHILKQRASDKSEYGIKSPMYQQTTVKGDRSSFCRALVKTKQQMKDLEDLPDLLRASRQPLLLEDDSSESEDSEVSEDEFSGDEASPASWTPSESSEDDMEEVIADSPLSQANGEQSAKGSPSHMSDFMDSDNCDTDVEDHSFSKMEPIVLHEIDHALFIQTAAAARESHWAQHCHVKLSATLDCLTNLLCLQQARSSSMRIGLYFDDVRKVSKDALRHLDANDMVDLTKNEHFVSVVTTVWSRLVLCIQDLLEKDLTQDIKELSEELEQLSDLQPIMDTFRSFHELLLQFNFLVKVAMLYDAIDSSDVSTNTKLSTFMLSFEECIEKFILSSLEEDRLRCSLPLITLLNAELNDVELFSNIVIYCLVPFVYDSKTMTTMEAIRDGFMRPFDIKKGNAV